MLFDEINPYKGGLPQKINLTMEDFSCDISSINLAATGHTAKWTILIYMGANNDLAASIFDDLYEMKRIGSNEDLNIVGFFMGPLLTDTFFARLNKGTSLSEDIIYRWYNMRASDPKVLQIAIELTAAFYPAENNLLIISGHGNGWKGGLQDEGIGRIYEAQGKVYKPPIDVFSTFKKCYEAINSRVFEIPEPKDKPELKYSILAFDACYMGNLEALSYFKNISNIIISSEDRLPGSGYPYHKILGKVKDNTSIDHKELAKQIILEVNDYYDKNQKQGSTIAITQVAIDSSKLVPLYDILNDFAKELAIYIVEQKEGVIIVKKCADNAFHFGKGNIDLKGFTLNILSQKIPANLEIAAKKLKDSFENSGFLLASSAIGGDDMPNGISIYFPEAGEFEPEYLDLMITSDLSFWAALLTTYNQLSPKFKEAS